MGYTQAPRGIRRLWKAGTWVEAASQAEGDNT